MTIKQYIRSLAVAPIPLLVIAMLWLDAANVGFSYESYFLTLALNFIFSTLASLFIVYLIGRSFLVRGSPGLLLLGCGVLAWGAAGGRGTAATRGDAHPP